MTQQDYEELKAEVKKTMMAELFKTKKNLVNYEKDIYDYAFDRAYALGKQTEIITQEEIEKAAGKFADEIRIPTSITGVMIPLLHDIAKSSYLQGAQAFLGKQEKDAEGEEMLTVSRKRVQDEFNSAKIIASEKMSSKVLAGTADMYLKTLERLFGSKCLPDEGTVYTPVEVGVAENTTTSNVDSSHGNVESLEPKPAEPKFKVGDKVVLNSSSLKNRLKGEVLTIKAVDREDNTYCVLSKNMFYNGQWCTEEELEPYTEPKNKDLEFIRSESVKETRIADEETHLRNLSQETANCDKHSNNTLTDTQNAEIDHFVVKDEMVDNIIKDGFKNHNRMQVASILMAALLAGGKEKHPVRRALELADALTHEVEEGGKE